MWGETTWPASTPRTDLSNAAARDSWREIPFPPANDHEHFGVPYSPREEYVERKGDEADEADVFEVRVPDLTEFESSILQRALSFKQFLKRLWQDHTEQTR